MRWDRVIGIKLNGKDFDIDDLTEGFSISFSGDVITIGVPAQEIKENFLLEITTNAKALSVKKFNNDPIGITPVYTAVTNELDFAVARLEFDATSISEVRLNLTSFDDSVNAYKFKLLGL